MTDFFQNNNYPLHLIQNCISNFLKNIFNSNKKDPPTSDNIYYVKLPFYGHLSYLVRGKLNRLLKDHFPDSSFRFVFTNTYSIKSFFPHKDKIPVNLLSNIVYQYTCSICKNRYLGSSTRSLRHRIAEHQGVSPRSGYKITTPNYSAIRAHCTELKHDFNVDNFKVVKQARQPSDLRILEALLIHELKPELNNQTNALNLDVI